MCASNTPGRGIDAIGSDVMSQIKHYTTSSDTLNMVIGFLRNVEFSVYLKVSSLSSESG